MNINPTIPFVSSKKFIIAFVLMLSTVLVAYSPMASYSNAQAVTDSALQTLKDKATQEIERRIANYQKTLESLKVDVHVGNDGANGGVSTDKGTATGSVDKNGASGAVNGSNGGAGSFKITKDGITGDVSLPSGMKDKVKGYLEAIVKQLSDLKNKVTNSSSLDDMQSLVDNLDSQFGIDQLTQVQAAVTQAIESMTGVLDNLKTTYNNLQSQVTALKDCTQGLKTGDTSVDTSVSGDDASVSCGDFNVSGKDVVTQAQSQLDSISTITTTISSVLASSVTLLLTLLTSFTSLTGGLGSLGSLGNLGNLSSLLSGGDLSSLTGSMGSITGILGSFTAITSQLDVSNLMSGNALSGLSGLSGLINI